MTSKAKSKARTAELDGDSGDDARGPRDPDRDAQIYARLARIFRTMSDVSRLRLLFRLTMGEWCVTELAADVGGDAAAVSQQLRVLRAADVVTYRRAGKHVYYSIRDAQLTDLIQTSIVHASKEYDSMQAKRGHRAPTCASY